MIDARSCPPTPPTGTAARARHRPSLRWWPGRALVAGMHAAGGARTTRAQAPAKLVTHLHMSPLSSNPANFLPVGSHGCSADCPLTCAGDCCGDGRGTVDDLITGVTIALGIARPADCLAFDTNRDGQVAMDELVTAVSHALNGCAENAAQ